MSLSARRVRPATTTGRPRPETIPPVHARRGAERGIVGLPSGRVVVGLAFLVAQIDMNAADVRRKRADVDARCAPV
jgi:hypothetical protein